MTDTPETAEEINDLDDAIAKAMNDVSEDETTPAEDVVEEPEGEAPPAEDKEDIDEEEIAAVSADEDKEAEEKPSIEDEPPQHWAAEDKEAYKNIKDPEARKLAREIDTRFSKAHQSRIQELNAQYEPVKQALTPYRGIMQQHKMSEPEMVSRLVQERTQFENLFKADPLKVISDLAKKAGTEVYFGDGTSANEYQMSPEAEENLRLKQQLESSQSQTSNAAEQQVLVWANETDEAGSLKRPHFEKVGQQMMALMGAAQQQGQSLTLDDAYQRAVRLDDDLYQQQVESQIQQKMLAQQKTSEEQNRANLEKARKGSKNLSGRAAAKAVKTVNSLDDAINLALQQQMTS